MVVAVRVSVAEGIAVGVRVAVDGRVDAGVDEGPAVVGTGAVAVRVGVRVCEGAAVTVGEVIRRITNERTVDQAPLVPPDVRPRTRHQKVRSLVNVCDV
jgi:hypothetical protein